MPWFWDLVTISSQVPLSLHNLPNLLTQPFNQIPHRNLTNLNLHAWLLEPQQSKNGAFLRQWQQELRLLRGSTRSVYEAKWALFTKWCITNQVDFTAPPVKSVVDFLMYLFEDRKLQLSTTDGYRFAIADKLGNSPPISARIVISLDCWIASTGTDPRGGGESPPGTFPWFCTS